MSKEGISKLFIYHPQLVIQFVLFLKYQSNFQINYLFIINIRHLQQTMFPSTLNRFIQRRVGKTLILVGQTSEQVDEATTNLFNQSKKYQNRWTMHTDTRLLQKLHPGHQKKKYWIDTIRHYNQKKMSFFVTNVLANKKISVPLR